MDPFSLPSSSSASSGQSAPSPEVLMDQLKSQLAQAYAEEFFEILHQDLGVRLWNDLLIQLLVASQMPLRELQPQSTLKRLFPEISIQSE